MKPARFDCRTKKKDTLDAIAFCQWRDGTLEPLNRLAPQILALLSFSTQSAIEKCSVE